MAGRDPVQTILRPRIGCATRHSLLLGTALASTLLIVTATAPTPAHAVTPCTQLASPTPIDDTGVLDAIICVNTEPRTATGAGQNAIRLDTTGGTDRYIRVDNSGRLTTTSRHGIYATTNSDRSFIDITNTGEIDTGQQGIDAYTYGTADYGDIMVTNSGNIFGSGYNGIRARTKGFDSDIAIKNTGDVTFVDGNQGLYGRTYNDRSEIYIFNSGAISGVRTAIFALTGGDNGTFSPITIKNTGALTATSANANAYGIYALTTRNNSPVSITNSGDISAEATFTYARAIGIFAGTYEANGPITVNNSGALTVKGPTAHGVYAYTTGDNSPVSITNSGAIKVQGTGANGYAYGLNGVAFSNNSPISIVNTAKVDVTAGTQAVGLQALSLGPIYGPPYSNSPISITNSGDVRAKITGNSGGPLNYAVGIFAYSSTQGSPISINNSGSVYAEGGPRNVGVYSYSYYANKTTITNTGEIGAQSHLAIDVKGAGNADIFNAGHIMGFVDLTAQNDRFFNQAGGIFETRMTSLFGGGNDLFVNQAGATVLAATDASARESSGFRGLETFKNRGLISLADGGAGDTFTIANTPGGKDLSFQGGGTLGVDAFLGGPGSKSDVLTIQGDVSGVTKVMVNNTNPGVGVLNTKGIRVVNVTGETPNAGNFALQEGPIDRGLFDYDLFFTPTGSGHWDLKSYPGASAQILPKLLTASQDLWHETSATWFDRTADLRVVLNGGGSPTYDTGTNSTGEPGGNGLTPGVWIKGGGSRLDRQSSATTKAYGNSYTYDLDNELSTVDLQMGVDMGKYDVVSEGDVLIFGLLGGFVGAGLDYDSLEDSFNFSGGQVGAYATYLKDGLFVDTLLNVHLYGIDTPNFGMPDSLNATTVGLRTDAGYRFGSFTGGAFFEPLATIEVTWADIDGFNVGGNRVSFSDDANVRGRIGGRVGTTTQAWEGTMMEPFLIASLWGNLSEDNAATLVSSGTTFQFQDDLDDVWGELSAGVNLFNFSQTTAVFAKVDYTFGEDVQGLGGKAGMRVAW